MTALPCVTAAAVFGDDLLGPVENQDSPLRLGVIQAFDG
jgi:hypothetical protein